MNMMHTAKAWLDNQRNKFLSERIVYVHFSDGSPQKHTLTATRGRTIFRAETDYGITVRVVSSDFLISSDLLPVVPSKGDEVICQGVRYEVLAPNNEPVWRWSGNDQKTFRIHTKEIGAANAD